MPWKSHYPTGPSDVPAGFTRPNASYKRKAWLAVAGLITFIVLYLALTVWFAMTGINRLLALSSHSSPVDFLVSACSLFLMVFLIKALFFVRKGEYPGVIELKIDVMAMRFEQDAAKGTAAHDAVCARQRALADRSPEQSDLAYLVTRCMPDGPAQDAAFDAGRRRWPDSRWYANGAGWNASIQGRYRDAVADYEVAVSKSPALRQSVAVELLRAARLVNPEAAKSREALLAQQSSSVRDLLMYEHGDASTPGAYRPIAFLVAGRLDEAVSFSEGTPAEAHMLRMAAASSGALAALRARNAWPPTKASTRTRRYSRLAWASLRARPLSMLTWRCWRGSTTSRICRAGWIASSRWLVVAMRRRRRVSSTVCLWCCVRRR